MESKIQVTTGMTFGPMETGSNRVLMRDPVEFVRSLARQTHRPIHVAMSCVNIASHEQLAESQKILFEVLLRKITSNAPPSAEKISEARNM